MVAGMCFIFPATLIVGVIAWAHVHFGKLPAVSGLLYGIKPVIIAIVVQALWNLGRTALKTKMLMVVGIVDLVLGVRGVNELALLFGSGLVISLITILQKLMEKNNQTPFFILMTSNILKFSVLGMTGIVGAASISITISKIFILFLKIGSVLFGSGYVLLAFLRTDFVERLHWITETQLLDAIVVGQFTPGPVFTTATFIGYLLAGLTGAGVAGTDGSGFRAVRIEHFH